MNTSCFRLINASSAGAMSTPGDPLTALSGCGSTLLGMRIVTGGGFRVYCKPFSRYRTHTRKFSCFATSHGLKPLLAERAMADMVLQIFSLNF